MRPGFDLELVAMPRADDAHLGFVEGIAGRYLSVVDDFTDGRNDQPLTDRPAHVRARVFVSEQVAIDTEDANGSVADVDDETAFFRDAIAAAGEVPDWCRCSSGHQSLIIPSLQLSAGGG